MSAVSSVSDDAVSQGLSARTSLGRGFCTAGEPLELATVLAEGVVVLEVGVPATGAEEQAVRARRAAIGWRGRGTRA
jgi:hypothetical protein